jgi:hypothetical protein
MTNEITENEIYWCRKCEAEVLTANSKCQKCGKRMETQSMVRGLGKAIVIVGIVIALFGLSILAILLFTKNPPEVVTEVFTIFTSCKIVLSGIPIIIFGAWQAKHGRTSKKIVVLFYGVIFLILIFDKVFSF